MNVFDTATGSYGSGFTPLSYWDYMNELVSRYAVSPALGMWEPMSEAEASTCSAPYEGPTCEGHQTCPNEAVAARALKYFFTTVGAQIHSLDPEHLVEAGLLGGGQCGTAGTDYQSVGASPGIDVLSVHDYYGSEPLGGDQWNGTGGTLRSGQGAEQAHKYRRGRDRRRRRTDQLREPPATQPGLGRPRCPPQFRRRETAPSWCGTGSPIRWGLATSIRVRPTVPSTASWPLRPQAEHEASCGARPPPSEGGGKEVGQGVEE